MVEFIGFLLYCFVLVCLLLKGRLHWQCWGGCCGDVSAVETALQNYSATVATIQGHRFPRIQRTKIKQKMKTKFKIKKTISWGNPSLYRYNTGRMQVYI